MCMWLRLCSSEQSQNPFRQHSFSFNSQTWGLVPLQGMTKTPFLAFTVRYQYHNVVIQSWRVNLKKQPMNKGHIPPSEHKWRCLWQQPCRTMRKQTEGHATPQEHWCKPGLSTLLGCLFQNSLLSCSHCWANSAHVTDLHMAICASSLQHSRLVGLCTCGVWADKICWAKLHLWSLWRHAGETWAAGVCWGSLFLERRSALEVEHKQTKITKIAAAAAPISRSFFAFGSTTFELGKHGEKFCNINHQ